MNLGRKILPRSPHELRNVGFLSHVVLFVVVVGTAQAVTRLGLTGLIPTEVCDVPLHIWGLIVPTRATAHLAQANSPHRFHYQILLERCCLAALSESTK